MDNRILVTVLLLCSLVSADTGPHPTAEFHVTYGGVDVPDAKVYAVILSCEKSAVNLSAEGSCRSLSEYMCEKLIQKNLSTILDEGGCYWTVARFAWPRGFERVDGCRDSRCHFGYDIPHEFRLAVYLPSHDRVFLSAEVTDKNLYSTFEADLLPDGTIAVRETTSFFEDNFGKNIIRFVIALVLTLVIEIITALNMMPIARTNKRFLSSIIAANMLSLPFVWFVFPLLTDIYLAILLGELFALMFETYFVYAVNKQLISLKKSFILSLMMNLNSFIFGGFIVTILIPYFFGWY
jgi:hypothetical protein